MRPQGEEDRIETKRDEAQHKGESKGDQASRIHTEKECENKTKEKQIKMQAFSARPVVHLYDILMRHDCESGYKEH